MTSPYLSSPSHDLMAFFNFSLNYPEPCSLTLEDVFGNIQPSQWARVLFEPTDIIELNLLPPRELRNGPLKFLGKATHTRNSINQWITIQEIENLVPALERLNRGEVSVWGTKQSSGTWTKQELQIPLNIYFSANSRKHIGANTRDGVALARCLFSDLDKITLEDALKRLEQSKFPQPTMTVWSGHGVHFYWRLHDPITDLALWTDYQQRLIELFNSDKSIHDPIRVMRVPGFENVNGVPSKCYICEVDELRRYALEDLVKMLPPQKPKAILVAAHQSRNSDDLARAIKYASKFKPVEEVRNSTAIERALALFDNFEITPPQVTELLQGVNSKSNNPLDFEELETIIANADKKIGKKVTKGKKSRSIKTSSPIQKYEKRNGLIVTLDDWRKQLATAKIESIGQCGQVFFDGSTYGAGKSTSDIAAMKLVNKTATFLPTHDACDELAKKLNNEGLNAVAHPPLSQSTCEIFGTEKKPGKAQLAQLAGLNVGESVCPTCQFATTCKYQQQRELARNADHVIATHARASMSSFEPAKGKEIVFIHEDVTDLIKPKVKVVSQSNKKDVPQKCHLEEISMIAKSAREVAKTWNDPDAIAFTESLETATEELLSELESTDLIQPFLDEDIAGGDLSGLPSTMELDRKQNQPRFKNADVLLRRAMEKSGLFSNGPALRLVMAHILGELDALYAVVDQSKAVGGKNIFSKALVGIWKNELPRDTVVWLENASTNANSVKEIVQAEIVDKTPKGYLEDKVPPIQFAELDVTQQTSGDSVRSMVRGILAKYHVCKKVGIITHQSQIVEIEKLAPFWRRRIHRLGYFRSGEDRASNSWLDCDLLIVLGTPRVPPQAYRDRLLQIGNSTDAVNNQKFGDVVWEGMTANGIIKTIAGKGYVDSVWSDVHRNLVKETLLQATGRARSVTDVALKVVVVSNENLGLVLSDDSLAQIGDREDSTLQVLMTKLVTNSVNQLGLLTDKNAISNNIAKLSVNSFTTKIASRLTKVENRTIRRYLLSLSPPGMLNRKGERGGYSFADWLIADYLEGQTD